MLNLAEINLNKLTNNALAVKKILADGVKFCAVVKADAYGHGAVRVANALYHIADCFAVALLEEGVELRRCGIDKDILVFNKMFERDLESAVRWGLTMTVQSLEEINAIANESKRQGVVSKVHLKFNSGMNRLGVDSVEELDRLAKAVVEQKSLLLDGMYSHLGAPENKKLTKLAVNKFLLANNLVKGYNKNAVCHLSASGGLIKGFQFDMVRVGILLYGYKPFDDESIKVEPVMKVFSPLLDERLAGAGQVVMYGVEKLSIPKRFGLIRFGYADGLPRLKVKGLTANRCMDLSAIDEQELTNCREGKDGIKYYCVMEDADQLAKLYKTIPYEILTKTTLRSEKIYIT